MTMSISIQDRAKWLAPLAALWLGLASTSTFASPTDEPRSITVHYAELDLSKPAGAQVLYSRIKKAAYIVCNGRGTLVERQRFYPACYRDAVTRAVTAINSPLLSALHGKDGTRVAKN